PITYLRCDKDTEYTSDESKTICLDSGINIEYTATHTPPQNGVSERDGQTLAKIARCLSKDGTFPSSMGDEIFFTTAYLCNRLPHSALGGHHPYFRMRDRPADISGVFQVLPCISGILRKLPEKEMTQAR
ncbi:unnamed protein product, partial [Scytosiphon promiscuus]